MTAGAVAQAVAHEVAASSGRAHAAHRGVGHVVGVGLAHVLDGHVDLQVERLAHAGVDDRALAAAAHEEAAHLLERPLRGGQPDPLERTAGQRLEPLEREREVRAALGARHGVDLVHDHGLGVHEELARLRREHQVERLGRGDQDVRRLAQHRLALLLGRVAGADGDGHVAADALERRAQVLLDVVRERLQRRDVDQPRLALALGERPSGQAVERPEERGERLARAGGGGDGARSHRPQSQARPAPAPPWGAQTSA